MKQSTINTCILGWFILVMTLTPAQAQQAGQNCTLLGRWAEGQCYDVLANENIVYLGNGAYLQIMDFTDPVNPTLSGRIALSSMVRGLVLNGTKMYVANYNGGLRIVDVSNPAAPVEIGALEQIGNAVDLVIDGSYAYIAAGNAGLILVDITDPTKPTKIGQLDLPGTTPSVVVNGNYAYTVFGKAFTVVNISDRTKPAEIAKIDLPDYSEEIAIQGNYVYVAGNKGGLRIIDISNPASPTAVGFCLENRQVFSVQVVNNTAYVSGYQYGFYIFDVTAASNPVEIGSLQNLKHIRHIAIQNDRAYLARSDEGMSTVNVAAVNAPVLVSDFKTGTYWSGLDVQGNYIYLCGGESIRILDGTDLMHPTSVSFWDGGNYDCDEVVVRDHYAYLAASGWGLEIIDITSPANPVLAGRTSPSGWSESVTVSGNYAYLVDYDIGLRIVDITNPQAPDYVGSYDTKGSAQRVAVQEPYAYVADYDSGLCIVNIADAMNPAFVTQVKMTSYTMAATARDNHLFLANGEFIKILDISNINSPTEIGSCPSNGFARQIQVEGDYAFVANGSGGAAVFDISNLQAPNLVGYYRTGYDVYDIAVQENLIFALDGLAGLYIIRFDAPVAVDDNSEPGLPTQFRLAQNYPNPFNPVTRIHYNLPKSTRVSLKIYNIRGQEIRTLIDEFQIAGIKSIVWDGLDEHGDRVSSGIYIYQLKANEFSQSHKMILIQ